MKKNKNVSGSIRFYRKLGFLVFFCAAAASSQTITITSAPYNATTGSADNAAAIQAAVNAVGSGGTVVVPAGTFLSGPVTLKSNMIFQLSAGATLQMTAMGTFPASSDFLYGSNLTNITITGSGVMDGQGAPWWAAFNANSSTTRPNAMIYLTNCTGVTVTGITVQNSPMFHIQFLGNGSNIYAAGLSITAAWPSPNTDGIDLRGKNVLIENCYISDGDDLIQLGGTQAVQGVTIQNCTFGTGHGLSIGGYTQGGVSDLLVNNCTFKGTQYGIRWKSGRDRGGTNTNLTYSNLTMTGILDYPFYLTSWYPNSLPPASDTAAPVSATTPYWDNITLSNITASTASGAQGPGIFWAVPEAPVSNVLFNAVTITNTGGTATFDIHHARGVTFNCNCLINGAQPPTNVGSFDATISYPACGPTPTATFTSSILTATLTRTYTPVPPTFTATSTASRTVTSTPTPTSTLTATRTSTSTSTPTRTNSPSSTFTLTATATRTNTAINTPTASDTSSPTSSTSPTATKTATATFSNTSSSSPTPSATSSSTRTPTFTASSTSTSTLTATDSPTDTPTATRTNTVANTPTASTTSSPTPLVSFTATKTTTVTSTSTASSTLTATVPLTNTATAMATRTNTVINTPTATSSPTPSASSTSTVTSTASKTMSPTTTSTVTAVFTATDTATVPVATATMTFTASSTASSSATASPLSTVVRTDTPTNTSTPSPTHTSSATATSSSTPSGTPTLTPTGTVPPTSTPTLTVTSTFTMTATSTATASDTSTASPTTSMTATPTHTGTASATPSTTTTETASDSPTRTNTPTATLTSTDSKTPTPSSTETFTSTASKTVTMTPTSTVSEIATSTVTGTSTPVNTFTPTHTATHQATIIVYPNPVTGPGPVTLQIFLGSPDSKVTIEVFTLAFRKVNTITLSNVPAGVSDIALPLTDREGRPFANGLYYVVVQTPQGRVIVKLLITR